MTVRKPGGEALVGKVSSGRSGFETPTGIFNVQRMDTEHFSDEYDQAPMPYAIFFSRGLAIHGTYERGLGHPVSHGCARLSVQNARDLYSWVEQYGATIEIAGSADEMVAQDDESYGRQRRARNKGCLLFGRHEFVGH
jgi:lipoprotein-anchoring transpeptidase ErfK/SrfK